MTLSSPLFAAMTIDLIKGEYFLARGINEELEIGDKLEVRDVQSRVIGEVKITKIKDGKATGKVISGRIALGSLLTQKGELNRKKRYYNNFALRFNLGISSLEYQEPTIMIIEGRPISIGIALETIKPIYIHGIFERKSFSGTYQGSLNNGTPFNSTTSDTLYNAKIHLGIPIRPDKKYHFAPYLGLASRYWLNDIEGTGAYKRDIFYLYLPIGLNFSYFINHEWEIGFDVSYLFFLKGKVKSYLTEVGFQEDAENDQGSGAGKRLDLNIRKRYDTVEVSLGLFVETWSIDQSSASSVFLNEITTTTVFEPKNETAETGLIASLGILF